MDWMVRRLETAEIESALGLAWETYLEFEAPDYGPDGVETFRRDIMENERFRKACASGENRMWGAFDGSRLVGLMCMRGQSHICLVFTHKDYQRRGVASAVFRQLLSDVLKTAPRLDLLTLNSSPHGLPFYLGLGFEPLTSEQTLDGIRFTPMGHRIAPPRIVSLRHHPELLERFIDFFARHWHSEAVYRDCLTACLNSSSPLPQWYLMVNAAADVVGGAGLITNDFISRMDLWPWLCALYIAEPYRGQAFGSELIDYIKGDAARLDFPRLYLCTDHVGYYEKYGFEYLGNGYAPWGDTSRIYGIDTASF
ncbi:MAG: GNAT family N-acetyltransferase [Victivallaceae bacterium]|nr:GNAT family N-acetyltransferase [Victivallaceae bacterium]